MSDLTSKTQLVPAALSKIKCRFEPCSDPPIGVFHMDQGCVCYPDRVQALCGQHLYKAEPLGSMEIILDFRATLTVRPDPA